MNKAQVKHVQIHLDWFFREQHLPHKRIYADGTLGPTTKSAIKDAKYFLGYLIRPWATGTDATFIQRLHHPTYKLRRSTWERGIRRRAAARNVAPNLGDRRGLARAILAHPNARFSFFSPTGGSARGGLETTANGGKAFVAATGAHVDIDIRILRFILDECDHGITLINCITNGHHMNGSQHYLGEAVDIDKSSNTRSLYACASRAHVTVLNEDAYHYHVHT